MTTDQVDRTVSTREPRPTAGQETPPTDKRRLSRSGPAVALLRSLAVVVLAVLVILVILPAALAAQAASAI